MIEIIKADITTLDVDVIVNAANHTLLGGGGVDGAIHCAAGPDLLAACRLLKGCETGQAKMTPAFRLPSRFVIHTVGPVWNGGTQGEAQLLRDCYENSFKLARDARLTSIAFPAISTGVYGFPKSQACAIALITMREFQNDFARVVACCYSQADAELYLQRLGKL